MTGERGRLAHGQATPGRSQDLSGLMSTSFPPKPCAEHYPRYHDNRWPKLTILFNWSDECDMLACVHDSYSTASGG
jgi:hypothetical protein